MKITSLNFHIKYCNVLLVACVGKLVGGAFAMRTMGGSWREALTLGALMNTRGLVELIVLNIGLDLGVLSSILFAKRRSFCHLEEVFHKNEYYKLIRL